MILLILQLVAGSADGQRYPVPHGPVVHVATKAAFSAATDLGLRRLGVSKPVAAWASVLGVFVIGKAIEAGQGHTLGPRDALGDLAWHGAGVALARRRVGAFAVTASVAVGLCRYSAPRWC